MAEIGIKELKATASYVIDEVEAGSAYVVTRRGRPAPASSTEPSGALASQQIALGIGVAHFGV
jgi:antitoxin (DNA-binding transcriptional repressor) of toxin-antitoxin stability system